MKIKIVAVLLVVLTCLYTVTGCSKQTEIYEASDNYTEYAGSSSSDVQSDTDKETNNNDNLKELNVSVMNTIDIDALLEFVNEVLNNE